MKILAALCGVMIVVLGVWSTGRNPTDVQTAVEILCLVGGLILCFLAVVISRLDAMAARLGALEASARPGPGLADEAVAEPEPS